MSRLSEITQEQKDRARQVAAKLQTVSAPIVRYQNNRFEIGSSAGVTDITGLDFIAATDQCAAVYNLFVNKRLEETRRSLILEDGVPRRPDSYPRDQWP